MQERTQTGEAALGAGQDAALHTVPETLRASVRSIVLIGPDDELRQEVAKNLARCHDGEILQFSSYPAGLGDVPQLLQQHDVIMIELDSNPEYALDLVESICMKRTSTVMVYSRYADPDPADPDLLVRCMRAGARELLSEPFDQTSMAEALVRAAARRAVSVSDKKSGGRVLVFCGAKGGSGVTSLACAFARALTSTSAERTLLIDLNLPLGDAGLILGISSKYSTYDALQDPGRLDSSLLSKLVSLHSSGLHVLPAPGRVTPIEVSNEAIDKLITVAKQTFDNIVLDAGSSLDLKATSIVELASTVYLVTQPNVSDLRNSNRLIAEHFSTDTNQLQIILNRSERRGSGITEEDIRTALTRQANWKIPDDNSAVERLQNSASWLSADSSLATVVETIARSLYGLPEVTAKRKRFSLKESLGKLRLTSNEDSVDVPVSLGLSSMPSAAAVDMSSPIQSRAASSSNAPKPEVIAPTEIDIRSIPTPQVEDVRVYKGKRYVRGKDNQWHLQEPVATHSPAPEVHTPPVAHEPLKVLWPTPEPITYGTALSRTQYNPTASVVGKFAFMPALGYVLPAGTHSLWCTFTPEDSTGQKPLQLTVPITVNKATPTLLWEPPAPIQRGTKLSRTQLSASAFVPGTFTYSPAENEELPEGLHTISVVFSPLDAANYAQATSEVSLRVLKPSPAIVWNNPDDISYGSPLSARELNAVSEIEGKFSYSPGQGEILSAGQHTLKATFTPADTEHYAHAELSVCITVLKATPIVNWQAAKPLPYGTLLAAAQLCAISQVPGTFSYVPDAGVVLPAGTHALQTVFTPDDSHNFNIVKATSEITIVKATPTLLWNPPSGITYGTALDDHQLNATSPVPGTFTYVPGKGAVLSAGDHKPSLVFTPSDQKNYLAAQASVSIHVAPARPTLTWNAPEPISYGAPLSSVQLRAIPSVPGTLEYSPACGETLTPGTHILSVKFLPADRTNYSAVQATVPLHVKETVAPVLDWPAPGSITFGTKLSSIQLNATAPIPGVFAYAPGVGELLPAGRHELSVRFTPQDRNLPYVEQKTTLLIAKAVPVLSWKEPAPIVFGTPLGEQQLNAKSTVNGRFTYTPGLGEILPAGDRSLSASFTPSDRDNYLEGTHSVSVEVRKALPSIFWNAPAAICYGTSLSVLQLNAKASVPGKMIYMPSAGTVLTPGVHTLTVQFVPQEENNYSTATVSVTVQVNSLDDLTPSTLRHIAPYSEPVRADHLADDVPARSDPKVRTHTDSNLVSPHAEHDSMKATIVQFPRPTDQPETRIYKGATYVKGDDGKWYLQD